DHFLVAFLVELGHRHALVGVRILEHALEPGAARGGEHRQHQQDEEGTGGAWGHLGGVEAPGTRRSDSSSGAIAVPPCKDHEECPKCAMKSPPPRARPASPRRPPDAASMPCSPICTLKTRVPGSQPGSSPATPCSTAGRPARATWSGGARPCPWWRKSRSRPGPSPRTFRSTCCTRTARYSCWTSRLAWWS